MAILGLYFTKNMLNQTGWPRKKGVFSKSVIDSAILDGIINQMIDWAASVGAGRPKLAIQVLAYEFMGKDWGSGDAPDIVKCFMLMEKDLHQNKAPHEIVERETITKSFGALVRGDITTDKQFIALLENYFIIGVVLGLGGKESFESWHSKMNEDFEKNEELYKTARLDVGGLRSLNQYYEASAEIVMLYLKEMDVKQPKIPKNLLEDARSLGAKL